jgi:hypothetical protein
MAEVVQSRLPTVAFLADGRKKEPQSGYGGKRVIRFPPNAL